jgi:prevent-host-death family protein
VTPISKSKLKPRLLEIMRDIEEAGEELVVTDHGRPALVIAPYRERRPPEELFAAERGRLVFHEDPNTPIEDECTDLERGDG